MFVVHPTKKLLDRLHRPLSLDTHGTTTLGDWYATALFWKPQVALFVNELTLLPVLAPLAPAATLLDRFPEALRGLLQAHEIPRSFIDAEIAEMGTHQLAKTANRSVLGSMNEFAFMGRVQLDVEPDEGFVALSLSLAEIPCGPLLKCHGAPADELRAFVRHHNA